MDKITAVIVEDSRLARNELKELLKQHPAIEVVAEADHVDKAFEIIRKENPQLLLLDINMPEKNGFDLLEMLDIIPITVFTTAYDEYAIKSFEYNAFDYLLKPISPERFAMTIEKVTAHLKSSQTDQRVVTNDSQIFIKDGERCWMVKLKEISVFQVDGNYTKVHFGKEHPMIYRSLNQIEERLTVKNFFRANRQQIINLDHIEKVVPWFNGKLKVMLKNGSEVEISRRQSLKFREELGL